MYRESEKRELLIHTLLSMLHHLLMGGGGGGGGGRLLGPILELSLCRACANASPQDMNDAMIGISSQVSHRNVFVCVFVCVCVCVCVMLLYCVLCTGSASAAEDAAAIHRGRHRGPHSSETPSVNNDRSSHPTQY